MCGRYAMGAAHLDFLEELQAQYGRLFPNRNRGRGGGGDAMASGSGSGGSDRALRLRGGGAGGDKVEAGPESKPASKPTDVVATAEAGLPKWEREQDFWPSYNIAPRQRAPVVRRDPATGEAMIETMQWGLIPHWTKYPPTGPMNTINARSETLIDPSAGGMWYSLRRNRCVIPAQGYYEWQKKGSTKVAHFTRLPLPKGGDGEGPGCTASSPPLLFFAGLWDTVKYVEPVASKWVPAEGDDREPYPTGNPVPLSTFTILTTVPARDIAWLHDRMPCILTNEDDIARWLDLGEPPKGWEEGKGGTADVLISYQGLDCYPVVPEVGKIGRSEPNYILPVAERKDGIKSFFQKQAASPVKSKGGTGKGDSGKPSASEIASPRKSDVETKAGSVKSEVKSQIKSEDKPEIKSEDKPEIKTNIKPAVKPEPTPDDKSDIKREPKPDAKPDQPDAKPEDTPKSQPKSDQSEPDTSQQDTDTPEVIVVGDSPPSSSTRGKRKRDGSDKIGGRQTKVVRPKEKGTGQASITSFFKSPKK